MTVYLHALRSECRRAFTSPGFFLASAAVCVVLFLGAWQDIAFGEGSVVYYYSVALSENFFILFILLCTLPHATSFCADWNSQFIKPCVIRTSLRRYQAAKVFACALSGACAVALGQIIFIGSLLLYYPVMPVGGLENTAASPLYRTLLEQGHVALYFAALVLTRALCGGVFSLLALCVSTAIPNLFVVVATPMLCYYAIVNLTFRLGLPSCLLIHKVYESQCNIGSPLASFLYVVLFSLFLSIALGIVFAYGTKRRFERG